MNGSWQTWLTWQTAERKGGNCVKGLGRNDNTSQAENCDSCVFWFWSSGRRSAVTCQVFQAFSDSVHLPLGHPKVFNFIYNRNKNPFSAPLFWLFVIYTRLKASCWQHLHKFLPPHFSQLFLHNVNVWQMCHKQGFFFCRETGIQGVANFCVWFLVWFGLVRFAAGRQRLKKLWPNKWANGRKWQMTVNHDRPDEPKRGLVALGDNAKLCLDGQNTPAGQWQSKAHHWLGSANFLQAP